MTEEILRMLQSGDTYGAVQHVQRDAEPREVAERFQQLVRDLYMAVETPGFRRCSSAGWDSLLLDEDGIDRCGRA